MLNQPKPLNKSKLLLISNMRLDKVKSFWISGNFRGALPKKSVDQALEEIDDLDNVAS